MQIDLPLLRSIRLGKYALCGCCGEKSSSLKMRSTNEWKEMRESRSSESKNHYELGWKQLPIYLFSEIRKYYKQPNNDYDDLDIPNLRNVDLPRSFMYVTKKSVSSNKNRFLLFLDVSTKLADLLVIT